MTHSFSLKNDLEQAKNLRWLLALFEQMAINFNKSDLIPIHVSTEESNALA
jgi:hypothetical protein